MNRFVKFRRGDSYENLHGDDIAGTEKVEMDITDMYREIDKDQQNENNATAAAAANNMPVAKSPPTETYTIQEAIDYIGFGKFQVKLSILTGFAWMADAMEMMILSILSPALHCEWQLKGIQEASITTVVFCGMMLSSSLWGSICDKYGRKKELILCSVFTCYFGILSAFSPNFYWMLILRGLVGFGIGGAPQSVTLYAEFLPSKSRARCVVLIEVFWAIGACFEVLLALVVMPHYGWSTLLGLSALPLLIFSLCCFWLPESARYDITKGDYEKAVATIKRIAEENGKPAPPGRLVEPKVEDVGKRGAYSDLFTPDLRKTTILLWIIWLVCAFSYYGIVLLTTALFENPDGCHGTDVKTNPEPKCFLECKTLTTDDYKDLTWTTFAEFPGLFVTVFIIDFFGRKKTMAFQFFVFTVFVLLVNICTKRVWLTLFLFVARAFISGAFQAAYVYTPEIYPTSMRALGLGACSGMARIGAIVTPFIAQVLLKKSSFLSISIYGCMCLIATIAALMLPIETKGREMQDVSLTKQDKAKIESKDKS